MVDRIRKANAVDGSSTRDLLIEAAAGEFNERGFHGTDTNRIARRAGFAPQTFYRHLDDKIDAFIAVYARWQAEERREIVRALRTRTKNRDRSLTVAAAILQSHSTWRIFRRSLRLLAVENDRVRSARAASRHAQLETIAGNNTESRPWQERLAALLTVERLCDAAADDEISDFDIDAAAWCAIVATAIDRLRPVSSTASP